MNRTTSNIQAILLVGVAALLLAAPAISRAENEIEAQEVTALSRSATKEDGRAVKRTRDGKLETYAEYEAGQAFTLVWDAEANVQTVYVKWYAQPDCAILVQADENGLELSRETLENPNYNDCYAILPEARALSLSCEGGMQIAEVSLYSEGTLPEGVFDWLPPVEKADLLVVSAHCDDELIYFGGTIPYYAGEKGLAVQVAYMANSDRARVDEALNGLWHAGVRNAPVFLPLKDAYTETLRLALLNWGEEETTKTLVELIRRFRPEVIVTHDLNGEYGHGAHMATAYCTMQAVPEAANEAAFPDSAAAFGVWQAQKLYLHLYPENQIMMDWNIPLSAFGGKTALEIANEAYHMHVSQLEYHKNVAEDGEYSSLLFGLAITTVGKDEARNDFFEHIDPARLSGYVAPTPAPTTQPTPTPTATMTITQAPVPTQKPSAPKFTPKQAETLRGVSAILFVFLSVGAMIVVKKQRENKRNNENPNR